MSAAHDDDQAQPDLALVQSLQQARTDPPIRIGNRELTTDDEYRAYVREQLDRPDFTGVIQHGRVDPDYSLVFKGTGPVNVGAGLRNLPRITEALDAVGIDVDYTPPKTWAIVARCLVRLADVHEGDDGAEQTLEWLAIYFHEQALDEMTFAAVERRAPYRHHGRHWLSRTTFAQWVNRSQGEKISGAELNRRLHRIGFEKAPYADGLVSIREGAVKVSNRYYVGPADLKLPGRQAITPDEE
jgi:hypothetical protein